MGFRNNNYNNSATSYTLIFLIGLLLFSLTLSYYLYMNLPGKSENLNVDIENSTKEISGNEKIQGIENKTLEKVGQFYPKMKFNHNSVSYEIDPACTLNQKERVIGAFDMVSEEVNLISFYEAASNADIEVSCSKDDKSISEKDYFIAGEGGAKEIIQTERYNVITQGVILLYGEKKGVQCDWPNVELHELLHVFGFGHSSDKDSLMYLYL